MNVRARWAIACVGLILVGSVSARAQDDELARLIGRAVTAVQFEIEGRPVTSPDLDALVAVHPGDPLRLDAVRDGESHLMSAGRYDDVQVLYRDTPQGLTLIFKLTPRHPVDRLDFTGDTGLNRDELSRRLQERYGGLPAREQPENVALVVEGLLKDEGFPSARVEASVVPTHNPDRATLVLKVDAGPRPLIAQADVTGTSPLSVETIIARTGTAKGQPFRRQALETALADLGDDLRKQGYYGAVALMPKEPEASEAGLVITLRVDAGSRVTLRWVGPQPPGSDEDYVPMRRQRSVDDDLLEDSDRRVATYWRREGYRNVQVTHTRETQGAQMVVTMHTTLGLRYRIEDLRITGNAHLSIERIREAVRIGPGDPYDEARIATGVLLLKTTYLRAGYHRVVVKALDPEEVADSRTPMEVRVIAQIDVAEGPQAHVGTLELKGNQPQFAPALRLIMRSREGELYVLENLLRDRADLESFYRDKGFENIEINIAQPASSVDQQTVNIVVTFLEGPQITVGEIRVVGNRRVSEETVKAQMALKPGEPFGTAAQRDSYRSLYNMAVFRHISIEEEPRVRGENVAHVIVTVEELPTTSISFGGGLQGGRRALTASDGTVADHVELAPRGFFEIGRRNLWGKNRSVESFTRIAPRLRATTAGENFGFLEYRVSGTYREPRAFNSDTDVLMSVTSEQAVRTGFNFARRALNAEALVRRLSPRVSVSGRYALESTRLFDVNITTSLLDRLFPQVRLSILSSGLIWDRRNDPVDPSHGTLATADWEVAARGLGSEVGYSKVFLQGSGFHPLPSARRIVLAGRAEAGFARGFEREVPRVLPDGTTTTVTVEDLPASQRFFAGGSTTVRGFQLDRLGVPDIINADGLSNGGNGVIVLNAEMRTTIGKFLGRDFGVVGFIDGGNVFAKAGDISFTRLRGAYGVGLRYNSPLGPVRLDIGIKTRRETIGGSRERGWEYHLNIGEAF